LSATVLRPRAADAAAARRFAEQVALDLLDSRRTEATELRLLPLAV
jgi:hypothetical protein